ncbi:MAG TPA: hypothetical protein VGK27_06955 [Candidatus Deferrimicrobiaceae bacterium]
MKKKAPSPDLEATIEAVVADHAPGKAVGTLAIPTHPGKPGLPGRVEGRGDLLTALKQVAGTKSEIPEEPSAAESDSAEAASSAPHRPGRQDKQAARLRADMAVIEEALDRARKDRKALKSDLQKAVRGQEAAERELAGERARSEEVARELFERWRREIGLDFESPEGRDAVDRARIDNADAIALATRALDRQAAVNARYGTVRALREEHDRIGRLLGELRFAGRDSLKAVPELAAAIRALETRRARMLSDPACAALLAPPDPEAVPLLLRPIGELPDGKAALPLLERFTAVAATLAEAGLVDAAGHERLRRAIEGKVRRVIRSETIRSTGRVGLREETFESLLREGGASRYTLLVDGNNLLITNEPTIGDGGVIPDFAGKRVQLNFALERMASSFARVFAVYDGVEDREEPAAFGLTVVFTHKGNELADDWIADRVARERKGSCILATDDAGLIDRCPAVHAVIGSRHLYHLLMIRRPDR